ncbi:MAG: error-prone DNA polymerase [Dehalococcoidia bacterium]|nr:error-prone DNA polymerase [Dehalococcoidia bacterium]
MTSYVELHCHSAFSLLDGASLPEELASRAAELDMPALALTDHDGLYGAVRFYNACKQEGIKPVIGAEMTREDGSHLTLIALDAVGYSNLCRMITKSQLSGPRGHPVLSWETLATHSSGLLCLSGCGRGEISQLARSGARVGARKVASRYIELFGSDRFYMELQNNMYPGDAGLCAVLVELAHECGIGYVATNNVHYARKASHRLHDVLTCIRNHSTLEECAELRLNAEFYLKSQPEMALLFRDYPAALQAAGELAERCNVTLEFSDYRFPVFSVPEGESVRSYLASVVWRNARRRYEEITSEVQSRVTEELALIEKLDLSGYFLIVWDIMEYARHHGIPAQGRGSAANSIIAYILGITKVDPIRNRLFLGRFLNEQMASIPDIDIDVSTSHREELIQYVYGRYGEEYSAMVCTYVTFQSRNTIREVGKVLGMPVHVIDRLARSVSWSGYGAGGLRKELSCVEEFKAYFEQVPWRDFVTICGQLEDFPRHVSIHNGGMLISSCPLSDIVPLERAAMPGRIVCQWDKDGVADAGLIKIDLLGLRMLSLLDEARVLVEREHGVVLDLDALPQDDAGVYDMIGRCDTIGVFQIESRAQMQTLPRTRPRSIDDLTVEVSLVRPGPIQGNMVHPYIRRRNGLEKVTYLHPRLEPILSETLGVILFQEQVIQAAIAIANFTPGEADQLRRAMSRKRSNDAIERMRERFMQGAVANGVGAECAERVFAALGGFAQYGFCKSHAAGFALICYQSAWLKLHYPLEFYCALLNNQPMGFYSAEVVVHDAQRHGVRILAVDANLSETACSIENGCIRLGLGYVKKVGARVVEKVLDSRRDGPFLSLEDFYFRTELESTTVENLILSGAFDFCGEPRRNLLWQLGTLEKRGPRELPLESGGTVVSLPQMSPLEEMRCDYNVQEMSTTHHPMGVLRGKLEGKDLVKSSDLAVLGDGVRVRLAGYVIMKQRPPTAKGFAFITMEDEEGMINVVIRPDVYERYRQVCIFNPVLIVEGTVQKKDGTLNVRAESIHPVVLGNEESLPKRSRAHRKPLSQTS